MSITIRLVPYNYSLDLPRDELLHTFPESLLSKALEQDPSATQIDIPNRDVTPASLNALSSILTTHKIPIVKPDPSYIRASNYLNIDILTALADPELNKFLRSYSDINLLDIPPLPPSPHSLERMRVSIDEPTYFSILRFGTKSKATYIMWYVFRYIKPETDNLSFMLACVFGGYGTVKYLLDRVDPGAVVLDEADYQQYLHPDDYIRNIVREVRRNQALYLATALGHSDIVEVLLSDKRVSYDSPRIYKGASNSNNLDVAYLIVSDPRADQSIGQFDFSNEIGYPEFLRILFTNPNTNVAEYAWHALIEAINLGEWESVKVILMDPRVNPYEIINMLTEESQMLEPTLIDLIINLPTVDINKLSPNFWKNAVKSFPEILSEVLSRSDLSPETRELIQSSM